MNSGRYRLIALLQTMGVPERHVRCALQTELGLSPDEARAALAEMRAETESTRRAAS